MESQRNLNNNDDDIFENDDFFSELSNVNLDEILQIATQAFAAPASNVAFSPATQQQPQQQKAPSPPPIEPSVQLTVGMPVRAMQMVAEHNNDVEVEEDFLQFTIKNEPASQASICLSSNSNNNNNDAADNTHVSAANNEQNDHIADSFAYEFAHFHDEDIELPPIGVEMESTRIDAKQQQQNNEKSEEEPSTFRDDFHADVPQLLRKLNTADASMMPPSIKQLYDVIKQQYSDFAFIFALSAQLCQNRVPMDSFVQLKLALLLSLASIGTNPDCPPIPIIAIGNDTYMANYLLMQIGELAGRFVGPELDIKAPTTGGGTWLEADGILLAKGGVYYAGDWAHLKAARSEQLFKTVECARITIGANNVTFPLQTALWAHWRSFKFNAKEQQIFNKFIKIFGIPIYIDDDHHEVLINYLLEQASVPIFESTIDHLSISEEDMRQFVEIVSRRTVDTQPEAAELLQQYFVASRCERPDCLSQQAFVVLKQFAESFAKLSFRHEVNCLDAVCAIYMCENFKQKFFGPGQEAAPPFEAHSHIGLVDEKLTQFRTWLETYIQKYYTQND